MACTSTAMAELKAELADLPHEPPAAVMAEHLVGVDNLARQWPVIDVVMQEAVASLAEPPSEDAPGDAGDDDCGDLPWHTTMSVVGALPMPGRNPVAQRLPLAQLTTELLRPPRQA